MTIRESIELDVKALRRYFNRLFDLIKELADAGPLSNEESWVGDGTAFIRPDMACNIYGLVDFRLARLADFHKERAQLPLSHRDIKGNDALDAYHKYFTRVARLPLESVEPSLHELHNLRKVRNRLIHGGGHVEAQQSAEIEAIPGVNLSSTLILLSDDFIWRSLEHASTYLLGVAEAKAPAP